MNINNPRIQNKQTNRALSSKLSDTQSQEYDLMSSKFSVPYD